MDIKNIELAQEVFRRLAAAGVAEVILCAGARNAPFVSVLSHVHGLKVYTFFDERSAGFFALGRMQVTDHPVAVCTTSGTAVAELLPAVIEADYQGRPLVVLSADRPRAYRGTGAPQTIIQPGIFSHYVEQTWDIEGAMSAGPFRLGRRPVHINVSFDEPLIDGPLKDWSVSVAEPREPQCPGRSVVISLQKPLVIAGGLTRSESQYVAATLKTWRRPVYAEAHSNIRGAPEVKDIEVIGGAESLSDFTFDGVIRVGQVPTLRYWRNLEKTNIPVINFSSWPYSGLAREKMVYSLESLSSAQGEFTSWCASERDRDATRAAKLDELLNKFPLSEAAWVRRFSSWVPMPARVFVGNSLPIREWDLSAVRTRTEVFANRGVNGIDGLVSTFLGLASPNIPTWGLIGDLSALYDLSGPWAARQLTDCSVTLAILNNGGGKIFNRLFKNPLFENRHDLEFYGWAHLWNWAYQKLAAVGDEPDIQGTRPRLLEIVPDEQQSHAFDEAWEKIQC